MNPKIRGWVDATLALDPDISLDGLHEALAVICFNSRLEISDTEAQAIERYLEELEMGVATTHRSQ